MDGPSAKICAGPDLGEGGLTLYLTITNGGRDWSYRGFASREALATLDDPSDLAAVFEKHQLYFCGRALDQWQAQPETSEYRITLDNVQEGGGFVNNG